MNTADIIAELRRGQSFYAAFANAESVIQVLQTLEARELEIGQRIAAAEQREAKAVESLKIAEQKVATANGTAEQLIASAKKQAEREIANAVATVQEMTRQAKAECHGLCEEAEKARAAKAALATQLDQEAKTLASIQGQIAVAKAAIANLSTAAHG